jgi:nucleotide-binding universal stress UspA family protein
MIEIRRILCPIDFSDYSRRALDHAVAIARSYKSSLTVLHVYSTSPIAAVGPGGPVSLPILLTSTDRDQILAETRAFVDVHGAQAIPIEAAVREGNAVDGILEQAGLMKADLLVMGTHGHSGFERLLLGSVTEKVLRKASCPVMTVPRRVPDAVPVGPTLYKRILCPVDFSESSIRALQYAMSMAQAADGEVIVLHVVEHEPENAADMAIVAGNAGMTVGDFLKGREEALCRRLEEIPAARPKSKSCHSEVLMTHGKPWREVLRVAAERQTDLIVIGVQGRGSADLLFFGSTTQHVVRGATCPVLTLRHL